MSSFDRLLQQYVSYLSSLLRGCKGEARPCGLSICWTDSVRPLRLWCSAIKDSRCFLRCRSSSRKIWWRRISVQSCWQHKNTRGIRLLFHNVLPFGHLININPCGSLGVVACYLIVGDWSHSCLWSGCFEHSWVSFGSRRSSSLNRTWNRHCYYWNFPQQALLAPTARHRWL